MKEGELEKIKTTRDEFMEWAEQEIKQASPEVVSQLEILIDHEKEIPDKDFRLFEMYKSVKDIDWKDYEPVEGDIQKELQEDNNNTRRVFFNFFSNKIRLSAIGKELDQEKRAR